MAKSMTVSTSTRSQDNIWLIGFPTETISGARLPSGRDVMKNFVYHHRLHKRTLDNSASCVLEELLPFWSKSRLPTRDRQHILRKVKLLYSEQTDLMKHRTRSNGKDLVNQKSYSDKLDSLFDISHANSEQLITNEEDRQFLRLQRQSRTGCIGPVDNKLAGKEERAAGRRQRFMQLKLQAAASEGSQQSISCDDDSDSCSSPSSDDSDDDLEHFVVEKTMPKRCNSKRKSIISAKVSAVLDRTNTSIRNSTMILASVTNEVGPSTSSAILSKSTVHRQRKRLRREAAEEIKNCYKCVVHWDGKLLPDITGVETDDVDRFPVLVTSLDDGVIKLLGVPKLVSGSGKASADALYELLKSWQCDSLVVGMCFDTTASNTGRKNGACTLIEAVIGRNLLWLACRHHMFEVLLSDSFSVCLVVPSSGPEILFFKRFRDNWSEIDHQIKQGPPLIDASESVKAFIRDNYENDYPREDYRELLQLPTLMVGLDVKPTLRKPGALHRARWMAKAIYSMKIEVLFNGNERVMHMTAYELQGIQRFNLFVVCIYLQSWFTSRIVQDAAVNDIQLIQRLNDYDDEALKSCGLRMMLRHSWYISQELATLALFYQRLSCDEKKQLVSKMTDDRGPHLTKSLPRIITDLQMSRMFFGTVGVDDSFLDLPVEIWPDSMSYKTAEATVKNLACVNDCAERGVALIHTFNETITRDEEQKQYLLQVVEKHRRDFSLCNRDELHDM